jgi:hypothetical protein
MSFPPVLTNLSTLKLTSTKSTLSFSRIYCYSNCLNDPTFPFALHYLTNLFSLLINHLARFTLYHLQRLLEDLVAKISDCLSHLNRCYFCRNLNSHNEVLLLYETNHLILNHQILPLYTSHFILALTCEMFEAEVFNQLQSSLPIDEHSHRS